jgi:hypothetical protein
MAEQHVFLGRHVIEAVGEPLRRRRAARVEPQDALGDEERVEAVADEIDADRARRSGSR